MKSRDAGLRLKRFELTEKNRKIADLEAMIRDFETMTLDLNRQIAAEEDRTGVRDAAHFAYSTFAKSAAQRRSNLLTSVADLRLKLEAGRREYEASLAEVRRLEAVENRDGDHTRRKGERSAVLG